MTAYIVKVVVGSTSALYSGGLSFKSLAGDCHSYSGFPCFYVACVG
jgi:hypothetical protein